MKAQESMITTNGKTKMKIINRKINMKKFIACLALFASSVAWSNEIVPIIYSWAASDPATNFDRAMIEEANRMQQKYTFVFDVRPGGGGVVPAQHTLNTPNAVLATSSAFFIRPVVYPKDSYDLSKFKAVAPKCSVTALITSIKYKSWDEVPKNQPLTIGVSGLGTTTHLISLQLVKKYPNLLPIPFKGTSEALLNVLNGSVDFSVNFYGDIESWTKANRTGLTINVLGVTGSKTFEGYPTLASQGFSKDLTWMSPPHQYITSNKMSDEKYNEIRSIIQKAQDSARVKAAYFIDRCSPIEAMSNEQINSWYKNQTEKWRKLSAEVKIN